MRNLAFIALLWALAVGMAACAVPTVTLRVEMQPHGMPTQVEQESGLDEGEEGLTFLCTESHSTCALFHREDASGRAADWGRIVLARGMGPAVEPFPEAASVNRYWGSAQGLPEDSSPVFIIPWHNQDSRPLLSPGLEQAIQEHISGPGRLVKHHIFPQEFKAWFDIKGINIHTETMLLEQHVHERIHLGPKGGPWNAEWRQFSRLNDGATKEEIWRYAGEMIH